MGLLGGAVQDKSTTKSTTDRSRSNSSRLEGYFKPAFTKSAISVDTFLARNKQGKSGIFIARLLILLNFKKYCNTWAVSLGAGCLGSS